jgi:ACS family hexuronate transporter-like MFS transporter
MPASTPAQSPGRIRTRWAVAVVATLVMTVSYIDRQTLAVLGPTVVKALDISLEQYGWVLSAFSFAYLAGAPLAGAVLDRTGARRGLVFAVLAWSAVAASHALVPSFGILILLRVLLGAAEAPSFPGGAQTMKRILPREERSIGIGMLFTGSSVGAMIAAPLAIWLLHVSGGWRPAFLGTALLGLLWIPLWLVVTGPREVRDALASDVGGETAPGAAPPSLLRLLGSGAVARAVMLVVFAAPSIMFGLNWSSHYLTHTFAIGQDGLARYLWLPPFGFDLGAVAFGALASRADRRAVAGEARSHVGLMAVAALLSFTMAAMPFAGASPWLATALASVCLAGGGGIFALLTADMLARVHPSHVSTAGGLTAAAQSLAYVVANPLIGRVVDTTHSYDLVLAVLGALVPPAAVAWTLWPVGRAPLPVAEITEPPAPTSP